MRQTHNALAPQRGKCYLGLSFVPTESPKGAPGTSLKACLELSCDAGTGRAGLVGPQLVPEPQRWGERHGKLENYTVWTRAWSH